MFFTFSGRQLFEISIVALIVVIVFMLIYTYKNDIVSVLSSQSDNNMLMQPYQFLNNQKILANTAEYLNKKGDDAMAESSKFLRNQNVLTLYPELINNKGQDMLLVSSNFINEQGKDALSNTKDLVEKTKEAGQSTADYIKNLFNI
jgi:hypothetical protein